LLGYFTFIILAAAIVGGAALPGKRPAEHRSANACIASDRRFHAWSIQLRCPFFAAVGTTAEAKKKSRKLKDIHVLAKDERVVKIGKNWDGRPSRRFIQPKTNVSLRRRPLTRNSSPSRQDGASGRDVDERGNWLMNSVSGHQSNVHQTYFSTFIHLLYDTKKKLSLILITPNITDRGPLIYNHIEYHG